MKKTKYFLILVLSCWIFSGCTSITTKDDFDIFKSEIEQKLATSEETNSRKFKEIESRIEYLQKTQEQQQSTILALSEDMKNQIKDLKIGVDDSFQSQARELSVFKKNQEEKNIQISQDIEIIKKSQNDLIRTSASLTDSMVNFQKDLLAVKTSMQQIATEFDSLNKKGFVQQEEIERLKKYYDGQIETLLKEIVRQESEIFALKQATVKNLHSEKTDVQSETSEKSLVRYHIVKKGETLSSIAKKYNTTTTKLKEINNLKKENILIGQRLLIP